MIDALIQTQWPLESIWGTALGFVGFMIVLVGMIGLISRSLSIPAMGSYLIFAYYGATSDLELLTTLLYVTQTLVIIGVSFKLWRLEGTGDI